MLQVLDNVGITTGIHVDILVSRAVIEISLITKDS